MGLQALLAERRLDARVRVEMDEVASGMVVRFTVVDAVAEAAERKLVLPFALSFSAVGAEQG